MHMAENDTDFCLILRVPNPNPHTTIHFAKTSFKVTGTSWQVHGTPDARVNWPSSHHCAPSRALTGARGPELMTQAALPLLP